jgi:hypothetical protein
LAVAIGLGAWEIGTLAAAAIAALFFASPAGQRATKEAVEEVGEALDRSRTGTDAPPIPVVDCPPVAKECPACPPPPAPRIDRVPPSRQHWPCEGDHMHTFEYHQNPVTCQCFLKEAEVICL